MLKFLFLGLYYAGYLRALHFGPSEGHQLRTWLIGLAVLAIIPILLLLLAVGLWYFDTRDWPMNIGGKPDWSWQSNHRTWDLSGSLWIEVVLALSIPVTLAHLWIRLRRSR